MADKGENVTPSGDENIAKETENKQSSSETKPDEDSELNDLLDSECHVRVNCIYLIILNIVPVITRCEEFRELP